MCSSVPRMAIVRNEAELRAIIGGEPNAVTADKISDRLNDLTRQFVERSPFVCVATARPDGGLDVSPRGDPAGFVRILDERTLLIPDRPGNKIADTLTNLFEDPRIALLFLIPGVGDTFRVNGTATVTDDKELLARDIETLPARRQYPHPRALRFDRGHQTGSRAQYMLAVIQHQEQLLIAQVHDERFHQGQARMLGDSEHRRQGVDDLFRIADRGKLTEPRAVRKIGQHLLGDLQGETRLAHPTNPGERDNAHVSEGVDRAAYFLLASDKGADLERQVAGKRLQRPQRWELTLQRGCVNLEDALGSAQVPQPVLSEIEEHHALCQHLTRQIRGGMRAHDLTAMRQIHQPRRPVHRRTEVVTLT